LPQGVGLFETARSSSAWAKPCNNPNSPPTSGTTLRLGGSRYQLLATLDSSAEAKGPADFALLHGDGFGRIELIVKEGDKPIRLHVNQDEVRDKVEPRWRG
jgi:hypothetical protein